MQNSLEKFPPSGHLLKPDSCPNQQLRSLNTKPERCVVWNMEPGMWATQTGDLEGLEGSPSDTAIDLTRDKGCRAAFPQSTPG